MIRAQLREKGGFTPNVICAYSIQQWCNLFYSTVVKSGVLNISMT